MVTDPVIPRAHHKVRIEVLDALRGVAALGVVLYHFTERYAQVNGASPLPFKLGWGAQGVDLFFMISGFVIVMTLDRSRHALDFIVSRLSRLYPAYWACLVLTLLSIALVGTDGMAAWRLGAGDIALNFTMLQEFVKRPNVDGVYWTLAVELRFYAWMLLLWQLGALRKPLWVVTAWCVLCLFQGQLPGWLRVHGLLEWFPLFGIGIVAFDAARRHWSIWHVALIVLALLVNAQHRPAGLAMVDGVLAAAFVLLVRWRPTHVPPPLLWLGAVSYPLYLLHQNIGFALIHRLDGGGLGFMLALALVLLLAGFVHSRVEQPALRLIRGRYERWRLRDDAVVRS